MRGCMQRKTRVENTGKHGTCMSGIKITFFNRKTVKTGVFALYGMRIFYLWRRRMPAPFVRRPRATWHVFMALLPVLGTFLSGDVAVWRASVATKYISCWRGIDTQSHSSCQGRLYVPAAYSRHAPGMPMYTSERGCWPAAIKCTMRAWTPRKAVPACIRHSLRI